jgi:hypothetical protein
MRRPAPKCRHAYERGERKREPGAQIEDQQAFHRTRWIMIGRM